MHPFSVLRPKAPRATVSEQKANKEKALFMPESLAVRRSCMSATITRVHEVLDAFAARDHSGEILTAVRHFPARDAQWADFPAWVHADLASCYLAVANERTFGTLAGWLMAPQSLLAGLVGKAAVHVADAMLGATLTLGTA